MIPRSLYPAEPWPIALVSRHPCLSYVLAAAKSPDSKDKLHKRALALSTFLQFVADHIEIFAEARPLADAFRDMPPEVHQFLIEELARMRLFQVEFREFVPMLVPCEKARPIKAAKPERVTMSCYVPITLANAVRESSVQRGCTVSALIEQAIKAYFPDI